MSSMSNDEKRRPLLSTPLTRDALPDVLYQCNPNILATSLARFVVTSLALDLQTLLDIIKTCKACSPMLESVELPWQVAVQQAYSNYLDVDPRSWMQKLYVMTTPDLKIITRVVSVLHPVTQTNLNLVQTRNVNEVIPWFVVCVHTVAS